MKIMKIKSADCKQVIVDYCKTHTKELSNEFVPPVSMIPSFSISNWKRRDKQKEGATIVRDFDCLPYEDQLRAYVTTDEKDEKILSVEVQGE